MGILYAQTHEKLTRAIKVAKAGDLIIINKNLKLKQMPKIPEGVKAWQSIKIVRPSRER
jgi:hypothetical protein